MLRGSEAAVVVTLFVVDGKVPEFALVGQVDHLFKGVLVR